MHKGTLVSLIIQCIIKNGILGKNLEGQEGKDLNLKQNKKELLTSQESQEQTSESIPSKTTSPSSSEKSSSEKIDQKSNPTSSSISEPKTLPTTSRFTTSTVVTSPTATKPPLRRRHTTGPGMTFPATDPPTYSSSMTFLKTSPLPSPHLDKRFFDSSLIEMKSQASSTSTLDYDSTEEVWVRRIDLAQDKRRKVSLIQHFHLPNIFFIQEHFVQIEQIFLNWNKMALDQEDSCIEYAQDRDVQSDRETSLMTFYA